MKAAVPWVRTRSAHPRLRSAKAARSSMLAGPIASTFQRLGGRKGKRIAVCRLLGDKRLQQQAATLGIAYRVGSLAEVLAQLARQSSQLRGRCIQLVAAGAETSISGRHPQQMASGSLPVGCNAARSP